MVLAKFLTTHLLEPQRRRLRAKNYAAAHARRNAQLSKQTMTVPMVSTDNAVGLLRAHIDAGAVDASMAAVFVQAMATPEVSDSELIQYLNSVRRYRSYATVLTGDDLKEWAIQFRDLSIVGIKEHDTTCEFWGYPVAKGNLTRAIGDGCGLMPYCDRTGNQTWGTGGSRPIAPYTGKPLVLDAAQPGHGARINLVWNWIEKVIGEGSNTAGDGGVDIKLGYAAGYAASRAETLAEVRSLLQAQGFNLDEIVLPDAGATGSANAHLR